MSLDCQQWAERYTTEYREKGEAVKYETEAGELATDSDPRFPEVSAHFTDKGYVSKQELLEISRWKTGPRNDWRIEENTESDVERSTKSALAADDCVTAVSELTDLSGVGVPVASSVLTITEPTEYAVIDFRVLRALPVVHPELTDVGEYRTFYRYIDVLRGYQQDVSAYEFYLDRISALAERTDLMPREVEMALWQYDKEHKP